MTRILLIEDNEDLAQGLRNNLEIEGYAVDVAGEGVRGLELAKRERHNLIILDLMLPGLDGYRVLRELRSNGNSAPVLVLTARGEEADKVRGFRLGADDYVTKPFGLAELLARVAALLRRGRRELGEGSGLFFGDVVLDAAGRLVTKAGRPVDLAPREFDLLLALVMRRGKVASRVELLEEVWGYNSEVVSRTVDTHVAELRRKLENDPARPRHIITVRKSGYRLEG